MPRPRKNPRLLDGRGAISWVSAVLLAALASGAYLAWVWMPVYATHYEVKRIVREVGYQAVKEKDDAALVAALAARLRAVQQLPADGAQPARPLVDVPIQDITWEREGGSLHVAFDYDRPVAFPILDRTVERRMTVDLTMDVTRPLW
jgi:hypothetical protein